VTQTGNTPQTFLVTGQTVEVKANQNFPTALKNLNVGEGVMLYKRDQDYFITQIPRVSGAMVVMDAVSGEVLALSGGYDFQYTKFNCATQAMRQPGSAFKPIVYLAALENGYTPESIIDDKSISFDMGAGRGMYTPKNYSGRSYGPSPLKHGIVYSRNQMTVNLANVLGITHVKDMAARLNVIDDMPLQLSMSLGAGETTLLRLSTAYAAIINGGHQVQPHFLRTVIDRFGNHMMLEKETFHLAREHDGIIDWDTLTPKHELPIYDERATVLSDISCVEMTQMLIDVMRVGTGRKFAYLFEKTGLTLGGKTGTTNDYKDAWFMGFVKTKTGKTYIIGVFVGYPTPHTLGPGQSGSRVALPIFASFVERAAQAF
jgi:penicillin-binding protein 1A